MKGPKALGTILVNSSINSNLETKTLIKKHERILIELYRKSVSLLFYQTCLNERLLSNYTHSHTHTHTHIYIITLEIKTKLICYELEVFSIPDKWKFSLLHISSVTLTFLVYFKSSKFLYLSLNILNCFSQWIKHQKIYCLSGMSRDCRVML